MLEEHMNLIEVIVSTDKMTAEIMIAPEMEKTAISPSKLKEVLAKAGVVCGIIEETVEALAADLSAYAGDRIVVARGVEPCHGENAYIEYKSNGSQQRKPQELEDGRVDFYNVLNISNVIRGQLIAQKHPAMPGTNGITVTGQTLLAKQGKETVIKPGKNVLLNEDRTLLYAAIDGQVSVTDRAKINVFPVYEVKGDVDFSVGNIDFVGSVVIRGNVPTGFRIKAAGDIRIFGSVEGAELHADGSVEIKNGIVAQDKGEVVAGQNVVTSYIQNGNVTAGGSVMVSQSIMFSHVKAGQNVICKGTKGIIIGGTIQAGRKITAQVVGNATSTPTSLEVGVKPELRNELLKITKDLTVSYETLRKTEQGLHVLDQLLRVSGQLPADKKVLQIKLRNTQIMLEKEIKDNENRKKELEVEIGGDETAMVEIEQIVFPGTKLVFGKWLKYIRQEHSRTRFVMGDGEIRTSPLI